MKEARCEAVNDIADDEKREGKEGAKEKLKEVNLKIKQIYKQSNQMNNTALLRAAWMLRIIQQKENMAKHSHSVHHVDEYIGE